MVSIKHGRVKVTDANFRSAYSEYEIVLSSESMVEGYRSNGFHPSMQLRKTNMIDVYGYAQGASVGRISARETKTRSYLFVK